MRLFLTLILVLVWDQSDGIAADVPAAMEWDFQLASFDQSAGLGKPRTQRRQVDAVRCAPAPRARHTTREILGD